MSAKKILLSVMTASFILTACGGGGGSDDSSYSSEPKDSLSNGTRYYYLNYTATPKNDSFKVTYAEVQNKQFKSKDSNKPLNYYLLTENKLYTPRDIAQRVVQLDGLTHWTLTTIGNVKEDWRLERVNLSGKNIFDTVLPGYRQYGFDKDNDSTLAQVFLKAHGQEKFPEGSSCYRIVSQKNNIDYLGFKTNIDDEIRESFEEFDQANTYYVDGLNAENNNFSFRYVSGIWQNLPWTAIYDVEFGNNPKDATAVKFQNKLYHANFIPSLEKTSDREHQVLSQLLSTAKDAQTKRNIQIEMARIKTGCYIYNEAAAKSVAGLKSLKWS
ncbi:hypothetical protein [Acinetobacter defluvii]|uniref:hypothetical protein n=1 Tax=Acinetobacter defluvii TaxID=1871111 RepID=UPI003AF8809B